MDKRDKSPSKLRKITNIDYLKSTQAKEEIKNKTSSIRGNTTQVKNVPQPARNKTFTTVKPSVGAKKLSNASCLATTTFVRKNPITSTNIPKTVPRTALPTRNGIVGRSSAVNSAARIPQKRGLPPSRPQMSAKSAVSLPTRAQKSGLPLSTNPTPRGNMDIRSRLEKLENLMFAEKELKSEIVTDGTKISEEFELKIKQLESQIEDVKRKCESANHQIELNRKENELEMQRITNNKKLMCDLQLEEDDLRNKIAVLKKELKEEEVRSISKRESINAAEKKRRDLNLHLHSLKGDKRVICRIESTDSSTFTIAGDGPQKISLGTKANAKEFMFGRVLPPGSNVFSLVEELVEWAVDGERVLICGLCGPGAGSAFGGGIVESAWKLVLRKIKFLEKFGWKTYVSVSSVNIVGEDFVDNLSEFRKKPLFTSVVVDDCTVVRAQSWDQSVEIFQHLESVSSETCVVYIDLECTRFSETLKGRITFLDFHEDCKLSEDFLLNVAKNSKYIPFKAPNVSRFLHSLMNLESKMVLIINVTFLFQHLADNIQFMKHAARIYSSKC